MNKIIKTEDLQLADVISLEDCNYPFSTSIVKKIEGEVITLFRLYGTTANFSYTGRVICYIGFEEYKAYKGDSHNWILWERKNLK